MSTFYAVFNNPSKARLAVMALLNEGVPTDDISLVARGDSASFGSAPSTEESSNRALVDASSFVGRQDDPERDQLSENPRTGEEMYVATESPVGMGISSSEFNDSADSVDQTDDPQWLAEDSIEMGVGATQADRELHDFDLAVNTGYPTTPPVITRLEGESVPPVDALEMEIEEIAVPGFGVVLGGGSLATAALDYGDGDPSDDVEEMMKHFREEGVPDDVAQTYLSALDQGEALLAVGLIPGEVEPPLVETVTERYGGQSAAMFDAPRY